MNPPEYQNKGTVIFETRHWTALPLKKFHSLENKEIPDRTI